MDLEPWNTADMATASVKLQQQLFQLLIAKGLLSEEDLSDVVATLMDKMRTTPGEMGVFNYLERVFMPRDAS